LSGLEGFTIKRPFRGNVLSAKVENPEGKNRGVREWTVDGHTLSGNKTLLPSQSELRYGF
jgi:hypothetical protein